MNETDERHVRTAIRLAMNGRGRVEPNPMVGCVIVQNGDVIGRGFHAEFGGQHAEPAALASCSESVRGATAYVTLEPCCHTNKKTPPCAPRLIEAGIKRVVIGCLDPNPQVNGNGVTLLRSHGITVDCADGQIAGECRQLIAPFVKHVRHARAYVTLKWAQDANGCVAGAGGKPVQISNARATEWVHRLRSRCGAIGVGVNTILSDDPLLTVRGVGALRTPIRVVFDRSLRTPVTSRIFTTGPRNGVVLYDPRRAHVPPITSTLNSVPNAFEALREVCDRVEPITGVGTLNDYLDTSVLRSVNSDVLIEPGPTLASAFLPDADRVWVIESCRVIGSVGAPRAPMIPSYYVQSGRVELPDGVAGDNVLIEYLNTRSDTFALAVASADLVMGDVELKSTIS